MDEASSPDTKVGPDQDDFSVDNMTEEQLGNLNKALTYANLAQDLQDSDNERLLTIGREVCEGYEADEQSREEWLERNKDYMKLATQVMERKSYPWDGAANVKYPLLTTAALQFSARAYGSLIPGLDIVKAKIIGDDPDGQMTDVANKLSTHMSYKLLYEMEDWDEDVDKLCYILPIVGTMFKKVHYIDSNNEICSELISAKDIVVNYYTKKLKTASRITEIQWFTANEIKEKQNRKEWLVYKDFEFGPGTGHNDHEQRTDMMVPPPPDDETPRKFLIQYCRIDLDDDGYKEPYIVTVDADSEKPVRIVANFYAENIEYDDKKKVICIEPCQWFVKFDFLPNPDGGFYGIGFGILLAGLNETINTLTNQLLDAGSLANLQSGFIGRGLRDNKEKRLRFGPGEWKWVNNPGKDLKENIFPMPVREPSVTLFNLLGTLAQSGKEVASVADIFTGKMPGQNTPATTTMATIEQGLKVFTSIYKRIYRAMGKEFCMIFDLLVKYAPSDIVTVVGKINGVDQTYKVSRFDYQKANKKVHIQPAADPNMVSETQKLLRIQGLMELSQFHTINLQEMTRQALIYQGQDNIAALTKMPPPQPPMELQIKQMEIESKEKIEMANLLLEQQKLYSEASLNHSAAILNLAKARQADASEDVIQLEMQLERAQAMEEMFRKNLEFHMNMAQEKQKQQIEMQSQTSQLKMDQMGQNQELAMQDRQHQQEMRHTEMVHRQGMVHADQQNQAKVQALKQAATVKGKNAE